MILSCSLQSLPVDNFITPSDLVGLDVSRERFVAALLYFKASCRLPTFAHILIAFAQVISYPPLSLSAPLPWPIRSQPIPQPFIIIVSHYTSQYTFLAAVPQVLFISRLFGFDSELSRRSCPSRPSGSLSPCLHYCAFFWLIASSCLLTSYFASLVAMGVDSSFTAVRSASLFSTLTSLRPLHSSALR
ncbi:hypothetical protein BDW74DRAFT_91988 [Aspergillus multicolor]|uniref:uncharacterized protein n=1 Tax=Aspergillus multicolor TaxID=41759 RepID=UPI003CCC9B2A